MNESTTRRIKIRTAASAVEREPLAHPFGFKGGSLSELWQTAVQLSSEGGFAGLGLGTQSVLWSDASVFAGRGEAEGNSLMYALTRRALQLLEGHSFADPPGLLDDLFEELYSYGKVLTGNPQLRKTFILNALVAVDNAAWLLYARENGLGSFDEMVPPQYRPALSSRHDSITCIPVAGYGISREEIRQLAKEGYFFIKIKIGHPGTHQEMLEKDKLHLAAIHQELGGFSTPATATGKILYYLDANGRYESKELLERFLDHARQIGASGQIALVEEPFPAEYEADVSGLEVRIAADESAHTDSDALARIQMGYRAIALKAVAKTLSMTLKIAKLAHERNVPCFCADLTANPVLLEWNKNIAARLAPFPGLEGGLLETNGQQNYGNWDRLRSYSPFGEAPWTRVRQGKFELREDYYRASGGIYGPSPHYEDLVNSASDER
ncbi:MAG TPA: mandelate racemase/muconate lactonizing enzyme family protein [Anseongella sp.]|nr:mandelate racemase/muconate lactonizing enzyme family protein [Anseongella sp.]